MSQKLKERLGHGWYEKVGDEFEKPYLKDLGHWLAAQRKDVYVFPKPEEMFTAFRLTQPEQIKVVILGQDPYHSPNTAHGLAFSSKDPLYFPPSLNIILSEIESDMYNGLQLGLFECPDLTRWAKQGVFLLNTLLTVEKDKPLSHAKRGWEPFTGKVIGEVAKLDQPVVWMLWGNKAKESYNKYVQNSNKKHLILQAVHPAAETYGSGVKFTGCGHFSKANKFLKENGLVEIEW